MYHSCNFVVEISGALLARTLDWPIKVNSYSVRQLSYLEPNDGRVQSSLYHQASFGAWGHLDLDLVFDSFVSGQENIVPGLRHLIHSEAPGLPVTLPRNVTTLLQKTINDKQTAYLELQPYIYALCLLPGPLTYYLP